MTVTKHGSRYAPKIRHIELTATSGDYKDGQRARPGLSLAPPWPWVTAWPGPTRRRPTRGLSEPPALTTAHALTTALHMRPCKRLRHRFAAATGRGDGGDGGSGGACDARDAGGRAAAAGKLRDAHSRTLGHITGHTWCEQGHRTRQIWREFEGWGQLRTFLPSQKLPPVAP